MSSGRTLVIEAEGRGCSIPLYRVLTGPEERAFEIDLTCPAAGDRAFQGRRQHVLLLGALATLFQAVAKRAGLQVLGDGWCRKLAQVEDALWRPEELEALGSGPVPPYELGIRTSHTRFWVRSTPEARPGLRTYRFAIPFDDPSVRALDGCQSDHALLAVVAAIEIALAMKLGLRQLARQWLALRDQHSQYLTEQLLAELRAVSMRAGAPS